MLNFRQGSGIKQRDHMEDACHKYVVGLSCASGFMQSFLEKPADVAVIEHESVILR